MVSSTFAFGLAGTQFKREYCALSRRSVLPPVQPNQLTPEPFALNRPPRRDDPWSTEVSLTWAKVNRLQIQGNAIAVAGASLNGSYLNAPRPGNQTGRLALFVPAKPGETSDPILQSRNRFFHHGAQVPFIGVRAYRYGVATMDAFGRWSDWSVAEQDLAARLPEAPRLVALSLTPDKSRIAGKAVPHELSFEILWDWQDRSPKRFQLAGVFHSRHTPIGGSPDNGHRRGQRRRAQRHQLARIECQGRDPVRRAPPRTVHGTPWTARCGGRAAIGVEGRARVDLRRNVRVLLHRVQERRPCRSRERERSA
jgi:hypothetical protein